MKDRRPFIIEMIVGILFIGISFFVEMDYYSNMVFSMGFGIIAASVVQMIRITYWKNPKRQEAYETKKREDYINRVDERKQYLRMKSGHISYQIMIYLLFVLSFILALVRAEVWIIGMIFILCIVQWVIGIVIYRVLEQKM